MDGYKAPKNSCDITYGVAVHAFIDGMYQTNGDLAFAVAAAQRAFSIPSVPKPEKKHMSDPNHMIETCLSVWRDFIAKDKDFQLINIRQKCCYCEGKGETSLDTALVAHCVKCEGTGFRMASATEVNFSIPFYEDDYIMVSLTGTMDKIGKFNKGIFAFGDYKTTSARSDDDYKIKEYLSGYDISLQLKFYTFALLWMGKNYPESILGQIGSQPFGSFIDAIFVRTKALENKYRRSRIYQQTEKEMIEFESLLMKQIRAFSFAVKTGEYTRDGIINGTCQQKFGKCMFWVACKQQTPEIEALVLRRDFVQKKYDPLSFNKV